MKSDIAFNTQDTFFLKIRLEVFKNSLAILLNYIYSANYPTNGLFLFISIVSDIIRKWAVGRQLFKRFHIYTS